MLCIHIFYFFFPNDWISIPRARKQGEDEAIHTVHICVSAVCICVGAGNVLLFVLIRLASCACVCMRTYLFVRPVNTYSALLLTEPWHTKPQQPHIHQATAFNCLETEIYACPCGPRWDQPSAERI